MIYISIHMTGNTMLLLTLVEYKILLKPYKLVFKYCFRRIL